MRRTTVLITAIACFLFLSGAAGAQENVYYMGFYGFSASENLDEQQTKDKFSGPIQVDFDSSWGVQVRGGVVLTQVFTAEAQFEYITPFEASTGGNKDEIDVVNVTLNGKLTCPAYVQFVPYVLAGFGALYAHEDIVFQGATSDDQDWGISFRGGLGVDYYLSTEFSVGLEWAYATGTGDVDHIGYSTISFGVAYHF